MVIYQSPKGHPEIENEQELNTETLEYIAAGTDNTLDEIYDILMQGNCVDDGSYTWCMKKLVKVN